MPLFRQRLQQSPLARLAGLLLALAACGEEPVATRVLPRCDGPLIVSVSPDIAPVVSWTPACLASYVDVREAINPSDLAWAVYSPDGLIAPGLRYGVAPAGAQTLAPARVLGADTSYLLAIGTRTVGTDIVSLTVHGAIPFTSCGVRVGGQCRTASESFSEVTREGVRIEATVAPTTVARGDTAVVTFRFVNPTAQPITVDLVDACWTTRFAFVTPTGPSGSLATCEVPHQPLTIPANGAVERKVDFNGYQQLSSSVWACRRPGTYGASLFVNAAVGGRRVRSREVRWTLVEDDAARGICSSDI